MDARTNFLLSEARASATYTSAINIFKERQELLSRINELNRQLRELQLRDADAVVVARIDTPSRGSLGKKKNK